MLHMKSGKQIQSAYSLSLCSFKNNRITQIQYYLRDRFLFKPLKAAVLSSSCGGAVTSAPDSSGSLLTLNTLTRNSGSAIYELLTCCCELEKLFTLFAAYFEALVVYFTKFRLLTDTLCRSP